MQTDITRRNREHTEYLKRNHAAAICAVAKEIFGKFYTISHKWVQK